MPMSRTFGARWSRTHDIRSYLLTVYGVGYRVADA